MLILERECEAKKCFLRKWKEKGISPIPEPEPELETEKMRKGEAPLTAA